MKVLFIGDIVGPQATAYVAARLPVLRRELALDLVIANGENCAITSGEPWTGFGLTSALLEHLLASGVDVITTGNHGWEGPDAATVHSHPRVLRPANVPDTMPGKGALTLDVAGEPVTIVNLAGERGVIREAQPVWPAWQSIERQGTVIVDFHGDSAWEKMTFATAVDGTVAAVLGTHTHEATCLLHLLPGGTAFVADVGMTAPLGSPGGFPLTHFAAKYAGQDWRALPPFALSDGPVTLGAVCLTIEGDRTVAIERIV